MPKRKRNISNKQAVIAFHPKFKAPSEQDRIDALGTFPSTLPRPHALWEYLIDVFETTRDENDSDAEPQPQAAAVSPSTTTTATITSTTSTTTRLCLQDSDDPNLYQPTSIVNQPIPKPRDETDWLVKVAEGGQTFEEYVTLLSSRSGQRIRPIANVSGITIVLLPIVTHGSSNGAPSPWGGEGEGGRKLGYGDDGGAPSLDQLATMTQAFFQRPVHVLRPAVVSSTPSIITGRKSSNNTINLNDPRAFAQANKAVKFDMEMFFDRYHEEGEDNDSTNHRNTFKAAIVGRYDAQSGKRSFQVTSLLDQLVSFRDKYTAATSDSRNKNDFCIMGMTLEDLYDGPKDLFCAGMAYGGGKVAVFSFHRYHPCIKMSPSTWWDYGYVPRLPSSTKDYYSYYHQGKKPKSLQPTPLCAPVIPMNSTARTEYLRRSCKLLWHELAHLFGLDHCIYHSCLMMGTNHLVEDFGAPSHVCAVCLRKLQWRLGFGIQDRYEALHRAMTHYGMTKEARWIQRQWNSIARSRSNGGTEETDELVL